MALCQTLASTMRIFNKIFSPMTPRCVRPNVGPLCMHLMHAHRGMYGSQFIHFLCSVFYAHLYSTTFYFILISLLISIAYNLCSYWMYVSLDAWTSMHKRWRQKRDGLLRRTASSSFESNFRGKKCSKQWKRQKHRWTKNSRQKEI